MIPSEPRSWPIGHSLLLKTGFRDLFFFLIKITVFGIFLTESRKRKKIIRGRMLNFLFPLLHQLYHSTSGFFCLFYCVAMSLGMMLFNHCQCENISEDGKDKNM